MRDSVVIQRVSKRFTRYHGDHPKTFKEFVLRGLRWGRPSERFWALRDVSFSLAPGRMLGIIGKNGAGKSTLLRLIGGIGHPDGGRILVNGRIGALLELGAGFHPDLTGRENVFISGVISGLTRREVVGRFDEIVAFAELEMFIDSPLRTYSTGMQMRLAFAVAVHTSPQVLLIDEVLAVGDIAFQQKCLHRIAQFQSEGCAIVLISHEPSQIQQLCDEAMWLRGGEVAAYGDPEAVVNQYVAEMQNETCKRTPTAKPSVDTPSGASLRVNENRFGSMELEITQVRLLGSGGLAIHELQTGQPLRVQIDYCAKVPILHPIFGVAITNEDGQVCCNLSTTTVGDHSLKTLGEGTVELEIDRLDLSGGKYFVDVGSYEREWTYAYDYHWHTYPLNVNGPVGQKGYLCPPVRWEIKRARVDQGA